MNRQKVQENLLKRKRVILRNRLRLFLGWFGVLSPALAGIGLWIFGIRGGIIIPPMIFTVSIGCGISVLGGLFLLKSWQRSQSLKGVRSHG